MSESLMCPKCGNKTLSLCDHFYVCSTCESTYPSYDDSAVFWDLDEMKRIIEDERRYTVPNNLETYDDFVEWLNDPDVKPDGH